MRHTIISDLLYRTLQVLLRNSITFYLFYLTTLYLSSGQLGIYTYLVNLVLLFIIFSDFGISVFTVQHVVNLVQNNKNSNEYLLKSIKALVILSFAIGLIFLSYIYYNKYNINTISVITLYLLLFIIPINSLFDGFNRGIRNYKKLTIVYAITFFVSIVPIFYCIKNFDITGAFLALFIFHIVQFVLFLFINKIDLRLLKRHKSDIKSLLKQTKYIGLSALGMYLYVQIDVVVMGYSKFINEIAYLEIANKIFSLTLLPIIIVSEVLIPYITKVYINHNFKLLKKYFSFLFVISILVGCLISYILYLLSPFIYQNLFSSHYTNDSLKFLQILLLILPIRIFGQILTTSFIIPTQKSKILFLNNIFFGVVNLFLDIILVKIYGSYGIIYGSLSLGYISALVACVIYLKQIKNEEKNYNS